MNLAIKKFGQLLEEDGLPAALHYLNSRAPHRFTGVFRYDPPKLHNVALADAWNTPADLLSPAPLDETFCGYVGATQARFLTSDGSADHRLKGHVLAQNAVKSYCGVMLKGKEGKPIGTLCHFDTRPCDIALQELEVLETVADLIAAAGLLWD